MNEKGLLKEFGKYASLNVSGMIGLSCYILADTYFVAKGLGSNGLTALNIAIPVYSFMNGTGLMLAMGGATKFSIAKGNNKKEAEHWFTDTLITASFFMAVLVLAGIFFSGAITELLGADAEVFDMTKIYLKTLLICSPFFMLNNIVICFVRNDGNPKLATTGMIVGSFSNVLLDWVFIFVTKWGMFGAVFATCLSPVISLSILSMHFIRKKNTFRIIRTKPAFSIAKSILSLGFPSLIMEFSSGIVIIIFNMLMFKLEGNIGIAAYGVIANISIVAIAMYTGISQGIQPIISRSYGNSDLKSCRKVLSYALVTEVIISAVVYLIIFCFSDGITAIFNSENNLQLQAIAVKGLKLYFPAIIFAGFNIIISVFFTSCEKALPAHIISLLRGLFVIVPMAFIMSAVWGITGVWLSYPVTELIVSVIGAFIYFLQLKKSH